MAPLRLEYRQVAERLEVGRRIVELDGVFVAADLLRAGRSDQVLGGERIGDVAGRQAARLQAAGSRSIWICRDLPPNGNGIAAPGTVISGVRTVLMAMSNEPPAPTCPCRPARAG